MKMKQRNTPRSKSGSFICVKFGAFVKMSPFKLFELLLSNVSHELICCSVVVLVLSCVSDYGYVLFIFVVFARSIVYFSYSC